MIKYLNMPKQEHYKDMELQGISGSRRPLQYDILR